MGICKVLFQNQTSYCGNILSHIYVMKDTTNGDIENDGEKTSSFKLYNDFELLCFFYVYFLIIN